MSLSKNINPSLVLVQPRKTRPFITERLLMGRKESNQTNKQTKLPFVIKFFVLSIFEWPFLHRLYCIHEFRILRLTFHRKSGFGVKIPCFGDLVLIFKVTVEQNRSNLIICGGPRGKSVISEINLVSSGF